MNARLSRAELGISLGASSFRRKDASSGTFARHCRIEFMKQVLPRFESPKQPRGREEEEAAAGAAVCFDRSEVKRSAAGPSFLVIRDRPSAEEKRP